MSIYLHALALQYYRGIGAKMQKLCSFKEFNFFIGANNAGKSTILDYLHKYLNGERQPVGSLEEYRGASTGRMTAAVGVPLKVFVRNFFEAVGSNADNPTIKEGVSKLAKLMAENDIVWIRNSGRDRQQHLSYLAERPKVEAVRAILQDHQINYIWNRITGTSGGAIEQHWIPQTLDAVLQRQQQSLNFPSVKLIPAIREVGPKSQEFSDFSGRGLIDRLAEIQSPDHDMRHERKMFDHINDFLQTVTGKTSAQIEIPHNREHILVHMDNKVLPLTALGTGIHEVIMIAAFCTLCQNMIVCIEEPEIHLHPLLQRKLISFLRANTENQYFIATHSAAFIDTPEAAIFHVSNDGVQTYVRESILRNERFAICLDLGTKASDLLQSNAVIWVEGPSDRLYIQHWIKSVAPDLVEGIHFSIMFYGGRLLSHLSANDDEIKEFISLKALNQNLAIVIDSDKNTEEDAINQTKQRVVFEFAKGRGVAWVTAGREIENYVEHGLLQTCVQSLNPKMYGSAAAGGKYDHALYYVRSDNGAVANGVDKVKVARLVCQKKPDLDILDLRERLQALVEMIRNANV